MSTLNNLSFQIPEADLQAAKDALATIQTTLSPFLMALSPEERRVLPKMGDGTRHSSPRSWSMPMTTRSLSLLLSMCRK